MKGMSRILRGYSFKAVLKYCEGRGEKVGKGRAPAGRLIGGNMAGRTVAELVSEFVAVRNLRPEIEKATWHNSLRLPLGDEIADKKWCDVVDDYMQKMGFSPTHPFCIWAHDDESAVHIVASRIGVDGRLYLGRNENLVSTRHIQALEKLHQLTITKGPELDVAGKIVMPDRRKLSKPEIDRAVRSGEEPPRQTLQRLVDAALICNPTVVQLAERLEAAGVVVCANLASTGTFIGFSFMFSCVKFKASALGKMYSWSGLQARGVTYEQVRDFESLRRYRPARAANSVNGAAADAVGHVERPGGGLGQQVSEVGEVITGSDGTAEKNGGLGDRNTAEADAGFGRTDRTAGANVELHPAEAVRSGRAPEQDGGRISAGDDGSPGTGRSKGGQQTSAKVVVQHGGQRPADQGVGGKTPVVLEALIADHDKKIDAWRRQHAALGAPRYRIFLKSRRENLRTFFLGKAEASGNGERLYTAGAVESLIPELRRFNATGYDIYVAPVDPAAHYFVMDDLKPDAVEPLVCIGFAPCLVQSCSADSEQVILKVLRNAHSDEQQLADAVALRLSPNHVGLEISDGVQPIRMAGFSNKRQGCKDAVAQIITAVHQFCGKTDELLQQCRDAADAMRRKRKQQQIEWSAVEARRVAKQERDGLYEVRSLEEGEIHAFQADAVEGLVLAMKDQNRVDKAAVDHRTSDEMITSGWAEAQIFGATRSASAIAAAAEKDDVVNLDSSMVQTGAQEGVGPEISAAQGWIETTEPPELDEVAQVIERQRG